MAESKARNTDPRYSKLTIGVCPDQWGVWFPQDEKQIDWDIALDEMAEAGFSVMETGPFGYFPTDPVRLKDEMDARGFRVVAGTGWGILHQAEAWADTERLFRSIGETHAAVGAEYVVHLPPMFRDEKTGDYTDDRVLSTDAWNLYISNADRLGRIMKEDYGLKMVLHPHGDSHIETPDDIDRIFQATDPEYVGFCLDTGHIVYGDGDPMELCRKYPERISYVHIKAMDPAIVKQAHDEDWPFVKAVHAGCSVTPPAGLPDMRDLVEALADLDKELYVVCEQDMYGCDKDYPKPTAIRTREYLRLAGGLRTSASVPGLAAGVGRGASALVDHDVDGVVLGAVAVVAELDGPPRRVERHPAHRQHRAADRGCRGACARRASASARRSSAGPRPAGRRGCAGPRRGRSPRAPRGGCRSTAAAASCACTRWGRRRPCAPSRRGASGCPARGRGPPRRARR